MALGEDGIRAEDVGRPVNEVALEDDRDAGRSNFAAFLLGGVVVSAGLFGFLLYDSDASTRRDGLAIGEMPALERSVTAPAPRIEGATPTR